ncbi:tetratricopeptide repeat protein [Bdellovibrionales bacterium]|nr:tetratricopeptide repeat protein [Bdellovibrionales bacterium]
MKEMLEMAKGHFIDNRYGPAETILNQLVLNGQKNPNIFHMLGTIYYDQGKFNKAIRSFKRALEIDPAFTDASVGLSIILNDLGRYDEGRKVFDEAKTMLTSKGDGDPYVDEKISIKHDELGELYFQYQRYGEALEQYFKALNLSSRKPELTMKLVECRIKLEEYDKAIKMLRELNREFPDFALGQLKLGMIYYDSQQLPEAVEQWESVLAKDPNNIAAQDYLRLANAVETTSHTDQHLTNPNIEL